MGKKSINKIKENYIQIKQFMKAKHTDYKKAEWIMLAKSVQNI